MQVFLPQPDLQLSAQQLDTTRLAIQAGFVINALLDNVPLNPALSEMWAPHHYYLAAYGIECGHELAKRHHPEGTYLQDLYLDHLDTIQNPQVEPPSFIGNERFHSSHRANLLRLGYQDAARRLNPHLKFQSRNDYQHHLALGDIPHYEDNYYTQFDWPEAEPAKHFMNVKYYWPTLEHDVCNKMH